MKLTLALLVGLLAVCVVDATDFTSSTTTTANQITISCQTSSLTVGNPLTCEMAVYKSGALVGNGAQPGLCQLRIVLCDTTTAATQEFIEPTYTGQTGRYRFTVYPTVSGTMAIYGYVYNRKVTKAISPATITVLPGPIDQRYSVLSCTASGTGRSCGVRNVDVYNNFVSWCNFTYNSADEFVGDSTCY